MNFSKPVFLLLLPVLFCTVCTESVPPKKSLNPDDMMVRIAEIEIDSAYLQAYTEILKEESAASVRLEPGVIAIFPMFPKDNPTSIRIVEIYADTAAYAAHLQTPHFKHYKTSTLHMVKSLKLIPMGAMDSGNMGAIFVKLRE